MAYSLKNLAATIALAGVAIAASLGTKEVFKRVGQDERPWAAIPDGEMIPALGKIADELNAKLPQKIDEHSSLVASSAGPDRAFTYRYSLPNHAAADIDLAEFGQITSEHLLEHACTDTGALRFLIGNVNLHYLYVDKDGTELSRLTVTPSDCL